MFSPKNLARKGLIQAKDTHFIHIYSPIPLDKYKAHEYLVGHYQFIFRTTLHTEKWTNLWPTFFRYIFFIENVCMLIQMSKKLDPMGPIDNNSGPLFTKRTDVLPQDLMEPQSHKIHV